MRKGQSYICFYAKDKPNHGLVKSLRKTYGNRYDDSYIIYASHWATDSGWTIDGLWLGYTLKSAIKSIEEGKLT